MAKKKTKAKTQTQSKSKGGVGRVIACTLAFVIVGGGIAYGTGYGITHEKDPAKWGASVVQPKEPGDDTPKDTISLSMYSIEAADFEAYGISEQAIEAKIITVSFTPENATDKRFTWNVGWKNYSSAWVQGKNVNDYVEFVPASNGAPTASIGFLQEFGESILVTATSVKDTSVYATLTVDYLPKIAYFPDTNISISYGGYSDDSHGDDIFIPIDIVYETCSFLPDEVLVDFKFDLDTDFIELATSRGYNLCQAFTLQVSSNDKRLTCDEFYSALCGGERISGVEELIAEYMVNCSGICFTIVGVDLHLIYDGEEYCVYDSDVLDILVDQNFINDAEISLSGMTVYPDHIIFGL